MSSAFILFVQLSGLVQLPINSRDQEYMIAIGIGKIRIDIAIAADVWIYFQEPLLIIDNVTGEKN
jgi:hypothetical protein